MNDPLGDMLTRIRNAQERKRPKVSSPASKLRQRVLDVAATVLAPARVGALSRVARHDASLVVLESSSHLLPLTHPTEVAQIIGRVVEKLAG